MTVRELIDELEGFDGNTEVLITRDGYASEIRNVKNGNVDSCWATNDIFPAAIIILGDQVGAII